MLSATQWFEVRAAAAAVLAGRRYGEVVIRFERGHPAFVSHTITRRLTYPKETDHALQNHEAGDRLPRDGAGRPDVQSADAARKSNGADAGADGPGRKRHEPVQRVVEKSPASAASRRWR